MNENNQLPACDLCGLPVEIPDFQLSTTNGLKKFCCEGCLGIYEMLHADEILPPDSDNPDLQGPDA